MELAPGVEYEVDRGVAVVTLRNPPVNAITQAMRSGLLAAAERANADPAVRALVITGANETFVAGADLRELAQAGAVPARPILVESLDALEAGRVPAIAAVDGHALGGGLEIALACHARVATSRAKFGLPEVNVGLLPGAGGTQRLPRVIGPEPALSLMLTGRPIDATHALQLGLVDLVVDAPADLRSAAFRLVDAGVARVKASERTDRVSSVNVAVFAEALAANAQAWRHELAPFKIVEAVKLACTGRYEDGLRFERAAFLECQQSAPRKALSYLFFAERDAAKVPGTSGAKPRPVKQVAVADPWLTPWLSKTGVAVHAGAELALAASPGPGVIALRVEGALVEVAVGRGASVDDAARWVAHARRFGATPVVTHFSAPGPFAVDQLLADERAAESLVRQGVFARESDVDVALVACGAWPRGLGGPLFAARLVAR